MNVENVSLREYSSMRVGGEGKLVKATSTEELKEVFLYARENSLEAHIIGEGTNSYFGEDLDSFLFILMKLKGVTFYGEDDNSVYAKAGAGEVWDELVSLSVEKGFYGIENLSYIPGTVGAAPVQNIGAYGRELRDVFVSCDVIDMKTLEQKTLFSHDCHFGYRDSVFKKEEGKNYVITSLTLKLSKVKDLYLTYKPLDKLSEKEVSLQEVRDAVIEVRKSKLPEWRENPNCGSFFKNPIVSLLEKDHLLQKYPEAPFIIQGEVFKIPAAWLIEYVAEMKGVKDDALRTWEKQPLVIVNDGGATADEVDFFAKRIVNKVFEKTGIQLEQEVNRVG